MKKQNLKSKKLESLTDFEIQKSKKNNLAGGSVLPYYNFPGYSTASGTGGCTGGGYTPGGSVITTCGNMTLDS